MYVHQHATSGRGVRQQVSLFLIKKKFQQTNEKQMYDFSAENFEECGSLKCLLAERRASENQKTLRYVIHIYESKESFYPA